MNAANNTSWFEHGASRIYYEDHGAGDLVLLLPGFAGSIEEFTALRDSITGAGYRVVTADLPGSGRSGPQPRSFTATYYEDDTRTFAALLDHLATGPAHVMGFSDGGEMAVLMASIRPDVVRSVVAWGAAGVVNDPSGQLLQVMHNIVDNPIPPMKGFSDYLIAAYGKDNARAMTQSFAGALTDLIAAGGDISLSKAGKITSKVLLIAGTNDFLATPPLVRQLAAGIPGAELSLVDGVGHDVYSEKPEWLTQTILDWLKRV